MAPHVTLTLSAPELASVLAALEAEWEHAQDAARDATGDAAEVAAYHAIAERNERLRAKIARLAR